MSFLFFFQVMKEVQSALNTAAADDSKLVLFSAVGSIFCCGLDFIYFIRRLTDDRKKESTKMAEAIRYVNISSDIGGGIFHCLVWLDLFYFKKPLIQQYLRHSHLLREKCAALLYTPCLFLFGLFHASLSILLNFSYGNWYYDNIHLVEANFKDFSSHTVSGKVSTQTQDDCIDNCDQMINSRVDKEQ